MDADAPPQKTLLQATGQASLEDAVSWIADNHSLERGKDMEDLLRALVAHGTAASDYRQALRRLAREVSRSSLDSATVLFRPDLIAPASRFRRALDSLAAKCPSKTIDSINASAIIAAQRENSATIETLCAVSGLSYSELQTRLPGLPSQASGPWTPTQIRAVFAELDALVSGSVRVALPGAIPARAIELADISGSNGWAKVQEMAADGVAYETLLAQRANGGSWLAHRNRTSGELASVLAGRLCVALDREGIRYRRSTSVGGDTPPKEIADLSGCDKQVALVVLNHADEATAAVIFSSARDSGTASKNASRLRAMGRPPEFPVSVVLAGPGWSERNETAELAADFHGRIYSERALDKLVASMNGSAA